MANFSALVLRNIVASVLGIDSKSVILSGILPDGYDRSTDNSKGNLYASNETMKVYSYSPSSGLVEVVGNQSGYSQNADGSYNSEYRVTFEDCRKHNKAEFYVELFHKDGWQQGSTDWDSNTVTVYGAPDWRAIEKQEQWRDSDRWLKWEPTQSRLLSEIEEYLLHRYDLSTGSRLLGEYTRISPEIRDIIEAERLKYQDEYLSLRGIIVDDGVAVAPQFTPSDFFMIRGAVTPMGDQNDIIGFVHGALCHIHSMGNLSAARGVEPGWHLVKKLPLK